MKIIGTKHITEIMGSKNFHERKQKYVWEFCQWD